MGFRRNMVIVLAHGLRSDAVSDSQTWPLRTPHLERVGRKGIRLVATAACTSDSGAMVSLLTGMHARQHGLLEPTGGPVACEGWPLWLNEAGYHVAGVGCVHPIESWLTESVTVHDVAVPEPSACAYYGSMVQKNVHHALSQQRRQRMRYGPFEPDRLLLEPEDDIDGFIAVTAVERLKSMPTDKPWALIVAFSGPGNDLPPPSIYEQVVDPLQLEEAYVPADFTRLDGMVELDYPRTVLQRLDVQRVARIRADYLGRVSLIDFAVGRLLSGVHKRQDHDRTWTIVTSDRGQLLGEHGLFGHRSFLAGAVEVPLLIKPPRPVAIDPPEGLASTVDLSATVSELSGCDMPIAATGRTVLDVLRDLPLRPGTAGACVCEFGDRLMLQTDRYKVVFDTPSCKVSCLYDLFEDPDERRNLLHTPAGVNVMDALRAKLAEALITIRSCPEARV